ncbi:MAG: nitrile hydratase subunit beta [Pseudomonadota bacterium]
MNGPHDMGGMQCYGPVEPEVDEPIFHADWEKRALAVTVGMGFSGQWNLDISRFARESLPPEFYLSKSYYQLWIAGLQNLMLERGMVTEDELAAGEMKVPAISTRPVVTGKQMPAALAAGGPVERDANAKPGFNVGDTVRTLNINPNGHTRLPRYARSKVGQIAEIHGCHVFPDSNARGDGESPQWLYSVSFEAVELFGPNAEADSEVMIDCWEPYLERA